MIIKWKHLAVAGLGGLVCGRVAAVVRENPDTARPILACTAGSALVGVALGMGVAVYREAPIHVYAISAGANFALCSFTFFGVRHLLVSRLKPLETHSATKGVESGRVYHTSLSASQLGYLGSGLSGGVAGSLASIISRHRVALVASTGAGGVVAGLLGQWAYSIFCHWRKKKAVQLHYPELAPQRKWTLKNFQDRFLGFWHQRSRVTRVESEILLLENDIAEEKKKIAALDEELAGSKSTKQTYDSKTDKNYGNSETIT